MNYILSSDEDRRLHKKYHEGIVAENVQGIALTKTAGEMGRVVGVCAQKESGAGPKVGPKRMVSYAGGLRSVETKIGASNVARGTNKIQGRLGQGINTHDQDHILEIRRSDPRPLKTLARRVLEAAETALGAVPIEEKQLWSEVGAENNEVQVGASSSSTKAGLTQRPSQQGQKQRQKRAAGRGTTATTTTTTTTTTAVRGAVEVDDHGGLKPSLNDRYRVYLYIHAQKCVGLLLAERIHNARVVLAPDPPTPSLAVPTTKTLSSLEHPASTSASSTLPTPPPSSPPPADEQHTSTPLMASTTPVPARMGISRIWVLPTFRGKGVAARMLEGAMVAFADDAGATSVQAGAGTGRGEGGGEEKAGGGCETAKKGGGECDGQGLKGYRKSEIAFSQPTEMGRKLAERWWGGAGGWLVYD